MSHVLELEADYTLVTSTAVQGAARLLAVGRWPGFFTSLHEEMRVEIAGRPTPPGETDWTQVAIRVATDLGADFSSENPHKLADRGRGWFQEP